MGGDPDLRRRWPTRSLPVSDLPNVDFPTISVSAALPGASPETMASSVATPLEKEFSTIAGIDSMTSSSSLGQHADHPAVRPRPRHRRGGAGRAGRDRPRQPAAPAGHAVPAHLPEGEPGRPADPVPRPHLADAAAVRARRVRPDDDGAAHLDRLRASPRCRCTARRSTRCASSSTRARSPRRGIGIDEVARAVRHGQRQPPDRHALRDPTRPTPRRPTASSTNAAAYRPLIVAYRERQAGPPRRARLGCRTASRTTRPPPGSSTSAAVVLADPAAARHQHRRGGAAGSRTLLPTFEHAAAGRACRW